jgi:hypothetical protein
MDVFRKDSWTLRDWEEVLPPLPSETQQGSKQSRHGRRKIAHPSWHPGALLLGMELRLHRSHQRESCRRTGGVAKEHVWENPEDSQRHNHGSSCERLQYKRIGQVRWKAEQRRRHVSGERHPCDSQSQAIVTTPFTENSQPLSNRGGGPKGTHPAWILP